MWLYLCCIHLVMVHIMAVEACWDQTLLRARLFVIRTHTVSSACLGPKRCLNTQGFCGRWSFHDDHRLWLLLNDSIKKQKQKHHICQFIANAVGCMCGWCEMILSLKSSFWPRWCRSCRDTHLSQKEKKLVTKYTLLHIMYPYYWFCSL